MNQNERPNVWIGAVYFRKSNPPREDWERDYAVAAEDGHSLFRHWCPWGAIEVAPGRYDWDDYDRQLDLAAEHKIRTILAEMVDLYPEWLYHEYPEARRESRAGRRWDSPMNGSCVTGGSFSMCLDNPQVREAAGAFLRELAGRYGGHPALHGYDVWNECSLYHESLICHCPATQRRFRDWLGDRYESLDALAEAWHRYSYTDWEQVELPRQIKPFPEVFDAIQFQVENAFHWMRWRAEQLRKADPDGLITAHGNARSYCDIAPACGDDWRAAEAVEVFGYTYWQANPSGPFLAADLIRGASRGKEFWRAEAVGDHTWAGRRPGEPTPENDAMHDPANIRLDAMISLAGGARAYQNPRWRPLLDGPLFGAFGWYGMDGSRTDRSGQVAEIARWANRETPAELWDARPVRGDLAILLCEEAQTWCYANRGNTDFYSRSVRGAYSAFLHSNVQCDFVKLNGIADYEVLYFPFPLALAEETAEALRRWVHAGGRLVCEGPFGYFDDHGHALPRQPNRGFREVFGCEEGSVSFAADRWDRVPISVEEGALSGAIYRQSYVATEGAVAGRNGDGSPAVVDNRWGEGTARLVGTLPGLAYERDPDPGAREWFAGLLDFAGKEPLVRVDEAGVVGRLWEGEKGTFLWLVNRDTVSRTVTVSLRGESPHSHAVRSLRGREAELRANGSVKARIPGRDAAVIQLA